MNWTKIRIALQGQNGFTLVEMLIVIVIVGVLSAASIPSLMRTRMNSNEAVVQKDLTTIAAAMEVYRSSQNPPTFPAALSDLGGGTMPFLDSAIAAGMQHGYYFTCTINDAGNGYGCAANPIQKGATGNRSFCIDHEGVLKEYSDGIKSEDGNGCPANEKLVGATPVGSSINVKAAAVD